MKTLILGIGSPFGDDQFGWLVAQKIKEMDIDPQSIIIEVTDRPGLNLLQYLEDSHYGKIILIDAVNANETPGKHFYLNADQISQFTGFLSSHNIGVAPSIALAKALGIHIAHIQFYGVQGKYLYTKSEKISTEIQEQCDIMAEEIYKAIANSDC